MTKIVSAIIGVVIVALAVVATTLYVGQRTESATTKQVIVALRAGCLRGSVKTVQYVNIWRADEVGNRAIASDPTQSPDTRRARAHEADIQESALILLDRTIDPGTTTGQHPLNSRDVKIVLSSGESVYSCDHSFPLPR